MYTEPEMYSITGKCGMTHIRISLRDILQLFDMKDRLEADGWKVEGPLLVPDFVPEG